MSSYSMWARDNSHFLNLPCLRAHITYTNQSSLQAPSGPWLYFMNISYLLFHRDYTGASLVIYTVLEKTSSCLEPSKCTFHHLTITICKTEYFMWTGAVRMLNDIFKNSSGCPHPSNRGSNVPEWHSSSCGREEKDWKEQRPLDFYTDIKVFLHILYFNILRITGKLWCHTTVLSILIGIVGMQDSMQVILTLVRH